MLHYSENIVIEKSEYYRDCIFFIDYIKIKRLINDFLAQNMQDENPDLNHMNNLSNLAFEQYFYLTYPMLDKASIEQCLDRILPKGINDINNIRLDDNMIVSMLQSFCFGILTERIYEQEGSVPAGVLYGEFLRIIDATIDHFSINHTMPIEQFINMFAERPKLMTEQWDPKYSSAICIYPWRAFELVCKLEEFMTGKKDKEALLYVRAAIEAGVIHREWKRFELQYGTKYCSRKTYNTYTDFSKKYKYYSKKELEPLIKFFKDFKPFWAKRSR